MRVLLPCLAVLYLCALYQNICTSNLPKKKPAEETAGFFVRFMVRAQTL